MKRRDHGRPVGRHHLKVRLKTAKQRTASSQRWLERQLNDPYVAAARREGYRSRAAFKLIEIDDKRRLLQPGLRVVDLGAAPGGWSQVASERVQPAKDVARSWRSTCWRWRRSRASSRSKATSCTRRPRPAQGAAARRAADFVLSDMAAQGTGHSRTDHLRIMGLAEAAADFALEVLAPGGALCARCSRAAPSGRCSDRLKRAFASVRHIKPPASRAESAELYVAAVEFRA